MPFLPPNQQRQSTEGNGSIEMRLLLLFFFILFFLIPQVVKIPGVKNYNS